MDAVGGSSSSGLGDLDITGLDFISPNYNCIGTKLGCFLSKSIL